MPHSLAQIYVHLVFSTKARQPWLAQRDLRLEMHRYLAGGCGRCRVATTPIPRTLWDDSPIAFVLPDRGGRPGRILGNEGDSVVMSVHRVRFAGALALSREERAPACLLWTVWILGSAALADLILVAVNAPGSYAGGAAELTGIGFVFMGVQLLLAALAVGFLWWGRGPWRWCALAVLGLNVLFFVIPMGRDPIAPGALILWQAILLLRLIVPEDLRLARGETFWPERYGRSLRSLLIISLAAWTLAIGFRVFGHPVARVLCLGLNLVTAVGSLLFLRWLWRTGRRGWGIVAMALLLAALGFFWAPVTSTLLLVLFDLVVLLLLMVRMPVQAELMEHFVRRPPLLIAGTFAFLVVVGTVLLSFPASSSAPGSLEPVDALFTATSAACVTGLTVVDTGQALTLFGQLVVLALMQAGGLGILVLSAFAVLLLGQGLGVREELVLGQSLEVTPGKGARRLVRLIVAVTLSLEGIGALVLAVALHRHGTSWAAAAWQGIFHSVSAFCNAGFSLWSDSLTGFAGDPWILLPVAGLITIGGLGFPVMAVGWGRLRRRRSPMTVHTRIAIAASLGLTTFAAVAFAAFEWNGSLQSLTAPEKLLGALVQSVTLRTAGFYSLDFNAVAPATLLMALVWMFIGASPGGTGGGVKTTTAAVLATAVPTVVRGGSRAVLFGRTIPLETIFRAASIVVVTTVVGLMAFGVLLLTQPIAFDRLLFESISALGTVGLSLGATAELDSLGKVVIVATMFAGRIGPLTLALLFGRRQPGRVRYPEARIMVG